MIRTKMLYIQILRAMLLAACGLAVLMILFWDNLSYNTQWSYQVHTMACGAQMMVPAGWSIPPEQVAHNQWNGTIEYYRFGINRLGAYKHYHRRLALVEGVYSMCGPEKAGMIYEVFFANPEDIIKRSFEKLRDWYEDPNARRGHYDPRKHALLWHEAEHIMINGVPVYSEKHIARIKYFPYSDTIDVFNWKVWFYTPRLAISLSAGCHEPNRERFEPVFATIFNSVIMPQEPACTP